MGEVEYEHTRACAWSVCSLFAHRPRRRSCELRKKIRKNSQNDFALSILHTTKFKMSVRWVTPCDCRSFRGRSSLPRSVCGCARSARLLSCVSRFFFLRTLIFFVGICFCLVVFVPSSSSCFARLFPPPLTSAVCVSCPVRTSCFRWCVSRVCSFCFALFLACSNVFSLFDGLVLCSSTLAFS